MMTETTQAHDWEAMGRDARARSATPLMISGAANPGPDAIFVFRWEVPKVLGPMVLALYQPDAEAFMRGFFEGPPKGEAE